MSADRYTLVPGTRALLRDLGLSVARVLRSARLPAGILSHDPVVLTPAEYNAFWDAVEAESDDPDLPASIGRALSVEVFTPPLFAALCSANLRLASERIRAFKPLIGPVTLEVSTTSSGTTLTFVWPEWHEPARLLAASEFAFWVALARIGTRYDVRPVQITARLPWPDSAGMRDYFGVPMRAGSSDSITFSHVDAERPFLTENETMWNVFEPDLRRRLFELQGSATTRDRVRAALHESLPAGDSAITTIARQLAVSPRTLQRQLHAEGTSYQAVLSETRERLARHYLADSSRTTAEIAYLLAYDDTNSFYRAFRTWTGHTPDAARLALVG